MEINIDKGYLTNCLKEKEVQVHIPNTIRKNKFPQKWDSKGPRTPRK